VFDLVVTVQIPDRDICDNIRTDLHTLSIDSRDSFVHANDGAPT
jgi:hypothetical protein